jgi:hypothetical protein
MVPSSTIPVLSTLPDGDSLLRMFHFCCVSKAPPTTKRATYPILLGSFPVTALCCWAAKTTYSTARRGNLSKFPVRFSIVDACARILKEIITAPSPRGARWMMEPGHDDPGVVVLKLVEERLEL